MRKQSSTLAALFLLAAPFVLAEETDEVAASPTEESVEAEQHENLVANSSGPRKMSGMSVLGNEEAPKSLVIIPWKSSELGDDISLSDTLDDRARPVDKEVFMRELKFYEIRSSE